MSEYLEVMLKRVLDAVGLCIRKNFYNCLNGYEMVGHNINRIHKLDFEKQKNLGEIKP